MLPQTTAGRAIHRGNYFVLKDTPMFSEKLHGRVSPARQHRDPTCEVTSMPFTHAASSSLAHDGDTVLGRQNGPVPPASFKKTNGDHSSLFCDYPTERSLHSLARAESTSLFLSLGDASSSTLQQRPFAQIVSHDSDALGGAFLVQQSWYVEALLRRIIELEGDNDLLRLVLLEGSERRTRQRLFDGSTSSHEANSRAIQLQEHQHREILSRISEVERDAKSHFREELDELERRHLAAMKALQETTKAERPETTLSRAEGQRGKEHVPHSMEGLEVSHLEKERRSVADMRIFCHAEHHSNEAVDHRIAYLEERVAYWKREAERERERGRQYREDALKELQRMHAVFQHALGAMDSTTPGSAITAATGEVVSPENRLHGIYAELGEERHAGSTIITTVKASKEINDAKEAFSAAYGFSTPISTTSPNLSSDKTNAACETFTDAVLSGRTRIDDCSLGKSARFNRSYHSDVYMRRESVDTDVDVHSSS